MRVPKRIRAFGREYQVVRDTRTTGRTEAWGFFDPMTDEFVLRARSDEFSSTRERQVFMHELIHMIDDNWNIHLSEDQTQMLAAGLVTVIEENKLNFADAR